MDNFARTMHGGGRFDLSGKKVLVLGLGEVTGFAVADALLHLGATVKVAERESTERHLETASVLTGRGVEVLFADVDPALAEWADLLIPSPGVPPSNPLLRAAAGLGRPIWSEIELGWRLAQGPVLAITGTNGKTTTTELLTSLLRKASCQAVPAGNIGIPLVQAARSHGRDTVLVSEVSSFQLAFVEDFRPRVSIVLNVADDHIDWHGDRDGYLKAKARITENQEGDDFCIVNGADEGALTIAGGSKGSLGVFGLDHPHDLRLRTEDLLQRDISLAAGISGGILSLWTPEEQVAIIASSDIRSTGASNLQNVLAAAGAAFLWTHDVESIANAIREFEPLPHRMNLVENKNGIIFINDSKATNPHAALAALEGMTRVVLIAGGRSKGISLRPLAAAAPACKAVIVMGEAAGELKTVFEGIPVREAGSVEAAVSIASEIARPGDTVLLSPGCSSLDQYGSYAERGERFVQAVHGLQ